MNYALFSRFSRTRYRIHRRWREKSKASELFSLSRPIIKKCLKLKESKESLKENAPKRPWKKLDPEALLAYVEAHPDEKQSDCSLFLYKLCSHF
jgi:hypothetical protein